MDGEEDKTPVITIQGNAESSNLVVGNNNQTTIQHHHIPSDFLHKFSIHQWLGIALILLSLVTMSAIIIFQIKPHQPPIMTGEFRIALARFAEDGAGLPDQIGYTISESIYSRLTSDLAEISAGPKVEIWSTDRIGVIDGKTPEIRAQKASELAQKIHAHMIIYGIVKAEKNQTTITPEFYLDTSGFYEGAEIIGQYSGNIALPLANTPRWTYEFNKKMRTQANVISSFSQGLSLFAVQDYAGALKIFQAIDKIEDWNDNEGRKTLYALTGFAAGKVKDFDLTEEMLKKSLILDPEYARPYIGLANLAYLRALLPIEKTNKPADADFELLQQCDAYLKYARNAIHKPPLAEVETKIHFSQGQCNLMKTYSGHDTSYTQAIGDFHYVIDAYNKGANLRVQEMAGESYARLGLIYELTNQPVMAGENYQKAADTLQEISPERAELYQRRANSFRHLTHTP